MPASSIDLPPSLPSRGSASNAAPSSYASVPWYRRRWATNLFVLTVAPVAGVLSYTGPLYYQAGKQVKVFPKSVRTILTIVSVAWLLQLFSKGMSQPALYTIAVIVVACVLGFKNEWPEGEA